MSYCKEMCYDYLWDESHWRSSEQIWLSYNKIYLVPKANKEIIDFDESRKDRRMKNTREASIIHSKK